MENEKKRLKKKENPVINLLFNIVIPVGIIYSRLTGPEYLGPLYGLILALSFPAAYFVYDLISRKKTNFISIIGFISIFLIGIIGVLELPSEWIAYEKAAIPLVIALAILISLKTPIPLVHKMFYNEEVWDVEKINHILSEKKKESQLSRIFTYSTYMLAASFIFSSVLNFTLAKIIIKSPTGTEAFTQELGKMMIVSKFVIAIPCTIIMMLILWYILHSMKKLTGLEMDDMFAEHLKEKGKNES